MDLKPTRLLALSAALTLTTAFGCASDSGSDVEDQTIHPHKSEDYSPEDDKKSMRDDTSMDEAVMVSDETRTGRMKSERNTAVSTPEPASSSASGTAMRDQKSSGGTTAVAMSDAQDKSMSAEDLMKKADGDIIQTATGPDMQKVSTLVEAIKAAELVKPLKGDGPFTVFAPTNAAFEKLPAGTLDSLLMPENKEQLQSILKHHVHSGEAVLSRDIEPMKLSTLNGKQLDIKTQNDTVMVNGAKVVKTDIIASNGIIHWVDTVILP